MRAGHVWCSLHAAGSWQLERAATHACNGSCDGIANSPPPHLPTVMTILLAATASTVTVPTQEWRDLQLQVQQLKQQQLAMAAMLQQLTESSAAAAVALQGRSSSLEAKREGQRQLLLGEQAVPPQLQLALPLPPQQQPLQGCALASPRQQHPYLGRSSPGSLASSPHSQLPASGPPAHGRASGLSRSVDEWGSKSNPGRPPVLRMGSGVSASASTMAAVGVSCGSKNLRHV